MAHREVIAARKPHNSLSAYGNRPDRKDARICFFSKPDKQGRKERKTWTDAHFWHYRPPAQWRQP
jgi:hypothetical protein